MKNLIPLFFISMISQLTIAQISVSGLTVENLVNPVGIESTSPRFSWKLKSPARSVTQSAYEIKVAGDVASLSKKPIWSTGKVLSDQSVWIPYDGTALQSGEKYFWQVRVWDNTGKPSAWSAPSFWQMGLLNVGDWKASWIQASDPASDVSPLFRKSFSINKKIARATAYVTAQGLYEASINGKRIGDAYLTPGWTSYNQRLQYQQYDVTNMLTTGANAAGAMLGNGWYRGFIGFGGQRNYYGNELALLFQVEITYADGSRETIISDGSWKTSTGGVLTSEIYHGETIDARKEQTGWALAGYDDSGWATAKVKNDNKVNLVATYNEPIRKHEQFSPVKIFTTPKGEKVIDFGQNLVGWVTVLANGKAGDKITLSHAEVLDKAGNFYIANLRPAKQQNVYILKGGQPESFEPHFTFQGFRYVKVEGYPGDLIPGHFKAVALYSDMKPTGQFTSSNTLINQLQHNIQWGQRGNFLDVPTDCPQRDERLGWTGDAQAFSRTAAYNFDVHNFFSKWLKDIALDQVDGSVPFVVPNVLGKGASGSAGWADAATIIPWNMYLAYGDDKILRDQYASMKAWVGFMERNSANDLWNKGFHFGDWLFYRPFDDNDGRSAVTDKYLIAQCFFAHSTELVLKTAKVLKEEDDVRKYSDLLKRVKDAFMKEYVTSNGRLVSGTQTAYVLALNFDMLPESLRPDVARKLVDNIKSYGNHLTTGFLGTPYLCHVLSRFGYPDVAYTLLMQETYPSWLYPVKMGATTIWERWDGIKPDSTFQTPGMNSFNHYAYGAIGDWMYRSVAGIDLDESKPGYKSIIIKPTIGGGLTNASSEIETIYGKVSSSWNDDAGKTSVSINIPPNTTASIYLPADGADQITESGKPVSSVREIQTVGKEGGSIVLKAGSGLYQFVIIKRKTAQTNVNPTLQAYVGKYKMKGLPFEIIEISVKNDVLTLDAAGNGGKLTANPSQPDSFTTDDKAPVVFFRDEKNAVVKIKVEFMSMPFEGVKVP
jgi:alpha-L-rhamnosidase